MPETNLVLQSPVQLCLLMVKDPGLRLLLKKIQIIIYICSTGSLISHRIMIGSLMKDCTPTILTLCRVSHKAAQNQYYKRTGHLYPLLATYRPILLRVNIIYS